MTHLNLDQPIKILIVDDKPLFHGLIGGNVEILGYIWQAANTLEEALLALKEAEERDDPFAIVTIDMNFEVDKNEMPLGTMILQKIKKHYPHIACIIISGAGLGAQDVLDLRDDYGLDYYISKDRCDSKTLDQGIRRALARVRPLRNASRRRELLAETFEKYQDIYAIYARNLARVEEKKAQKGIEVSVDIENQIDRYKQQLAEVQQKLREIKEEIERLGPG